jgi:mannose-6-phosphate isomerase-like protein (cupin superfamily)
MRVVHFTKHAADPLQAFDALGAFFLPLGLTEGNSQISCLHLERDGRIPSPSLTHAAALLVVHGRITVTIEIPYTQIDIYVGMGVVLEMNEAYSLKSEEGAILLIIEADRLLTSERAISTPQRIAGATWLGEETVNTMV